MSTKLDWVPGLKRLDDADEINRVNSTHTCVFDDLKIDFVTTGNSSSDKEITYQEKGDTGLGFTFINNYKLKELEGVTQLSL